MAAAATKVLPDTYHIFYKNHILGNVKKELHSICLGLDHLITDLRKCNDGCRIEESFDSCRESVLIKHGLRNDEHLQSFYDIRKQWAPVNTKKLFHARNLLPQSCENLEKIIDKYFSSNTHLQLDVQQLGKAICKSHAKEAQADYLTMFQIPSVRTISPVEKQVSLICLIYFRSNLMSPLGTMQRGSRIGCYTSTVTVDDGDEEAHTPALRVFIIEDVCFLKAYVLKRW